MVGGALLFAWGLVARSILTGIVGLGGPTAVLLALEASAEAATIAHGAKLGGCVASAAPRAVAVDGVVGLGCRGRGWGWGGGGAHPARGGGIGGIHALPDFQGVGNGSLTCPCVDSVNLGDLGFLLADSVCVGTLDRGVLAKVGVLWTGMRPSLVRLVGSVKVRRGSAQGV